MSGAYVSDAMEPTFMLTFSSMSHLKAGTAPKPRRALPVGDSAGGVESGERAEALRDYQDAQLEKKEIERRLQSLRAEIGVTLSALSQRAPVAYFDGWAPRDLPLLPSPIHRRLLTEDEIGPPPAASPPVDKEALGRLPPPGTMPDLGYLPAYKRPVARFFGRLLLLLGGFLSLPQRAINLALAGRLEALEAKVANLEEDRDRLRSCVLLMGQRSIDNFEFLDQCDRNRLIELHHKADQLRSEWRGDLERVAARLEGELAEKLELKAPGHRLALLEMEYGAAEMKGQLAWQRLLVAELRQRIDKAFS
jgi:hypothetical protein